MDFVEKVIKVEEFKINEDWAKEYDFVKVFLKVHHHGNVEIREEIFTKPQWESVQRNGYFER